MFALQTLSKKERDFEDLGLCHDLQGYEFLERDFA